MIQPFEINLAEATSIYNTLKAAGCDLSGWSPEKHKWAVSHGRKSDEYITVTEPTPAQRELLKQFGFSGAEDATWPGLQVQKHGLSLRDKYEMMSEAEQTQADLGWLNAGGFLSEEKMDKLANAGLISKSWRVAR